MNNFYRELHQQPFSKCHSGWSGLVMTESLLILYVSLLTYGSLWNAAIREYFEFLSLLIK